MTSLDKRLERQRALVARLSQRMAFELLVLERLERRTQADAPPSGPRTLSSILEDAQRRSSSNGR